MSEKRYGIFTERQRNYLRGKLESDLAADEERAFRQKIRQRVDTAFAEFTLLSKIETRDRKQIFEEQLIYDEDDPAVKGREEPAEPGQLKREQEPMESGGGLGMGVGFGHLLQFTYTGLREQGFTPDHFGTLLKFYISRAEQAVSNDLLYDDIEVEFEVETVSSVDLETARQKYDRSEELSAVELKALVECGDLTVSES